MPRIDWRLRTRRLTKDDMLRLMEWVLSGPEVPEGSWCKDFGAFTLAGEGKHPKTFLSKEQRCYGERI
ncbi:MAG: hypothetical protein WBL65_17920 [Bryobacteraceae bacterium]